MTETSIGGTPVVQADNYDDLPECETQQSSQGEKLAAERNALSEELHSRRC